MLRPRIIPCLLLMDDGLVKTIRFKKPNYLGDPINAIRVLNDKMVDELVLIDIRANKKGINFELLGEIASECFMPMSYGGGVSKLEDFDRLFSIGYEKVIVNTLLFEKPEIVKEAISIYGAQSIIASVDVKSTGFLSSSQKVFIQNGKINTKQSPDEYVIRVRDMGVGEIILNNIDREGVMKGYDLDLISRLSPLINIPLIALGGAGELNDMKDAISSGASGAAAGSIFVYQKGYNGILISYPNELIIEKLMEG
jgi:imidazole glycerol-phosphate synthase subunit HisF